MPVIGNKAINILTIESANVGLKSERDTYKMHNAQNNDTNLSNANHSNYYLSLINHIIMFLRSEIPIESEKMRKMKESRQQNQFKESKASTSHIQQQSIFNIHFIHRTRQISSLFLKLLFNVAIEMAFHGVFRTCIMLVIF